MSPSTPTIRFTDSRRSSSAHQGGVTWIRPESSVYVPPPLPQARDRSEQTSAIVVIVLTLACTALSIFDLFLLASGS